MDTPIAPEARRRMTRRGACLTVAVLCVLATLAGAVVRSSDVGHHHRHLVAATVAGADNQASGTRGLLDVALPGQLPADVARGVARTLDTSHQGLPNTAADTVRTRGPPATA